ncbi:hypothetical protein N9B90_01750 [bacterium]|nr:hypothetical protein [bacterium]
MSQTDQGKADSDPVRGSELPASSGAPSDHQGTRLPGNPCLPSRREHIQALTLALICAVLFLRDGLLPGRALVPHPPELFDVHMAEAKAAGTFDAADTFRGNVGMTDKYLQSLCWDRVMQDRLQAGELPRWTKDIGGGAPFVQQMAQPYQPINLLLFLIPSIEWYGVWYLIHLVLFGWFAYLFLRRIGCLHAAAQLGLVAATLGMWTQCKLHHNVILTAALSLWPMLSATHELVARGVRDGARRRAVGWLAMWTGLSWSTGFVVIQLPNRRICHSLPAASRPWRPFTKATTARHRARHRRCLVLCEHAANPNGIIRVCSHRPIQRRVTAIARARVGPLDVTPLAGLIQLASGSFLSSWWRVTSLRNQDAMEPARAPRSEYTSKRQQCLPELG